MISDCFTDKTIIIDIKKNNIPIYSEEFDKKFHLIARNISQETGVPENCIYNGKEYGFRIPNWHKIDEIWHYYKNTGEHEFFSELLGEIISEYFGLDTVHYRIAKLCVNGQKDKYGLVSRNFCDKRFKYIRLDMQKCGLNCFNQTLQILYKIKNLCRTEEEYFLLQNDLKTMIIRDFYTTERDRNTYNFFLIITPEGPRLAPLYDYGYSYVDCNSAHRIITDFYELNIDDATIQKLLRDDSKFQELLNTMMNANVCSFIHEVEQRHKILVPQQQKEHYKRYEQKVKSLVLENKLIK